MLFMQPLTAATLTDSPSSDEILSAFLDWITASGLEPYDHQEQAILELYSGNHVILNTPTGSGKTLVALAWQFRAICLGRRSYYTVPIKALANEKFLSLCKIFGPENVGMITGDATVNASAPVICCTAEILANLALREGHLARVDDVIMDEFHYYSDQERGGAWQIPLLTLPQSRFLLMSATLGDTTFFEEALTSLTQSPSVLIRSDHRPVPLAYEYSETPLEEKIAELVEQGKAPIYLVHFTQLSCATTAQNLLSTNFCSREEKQQIAAELENANFRSPYGKDIAKMLRHGIGIHHAGLLPKYRVLVEKLAQKGLLKVICGTDTLGVGVNVPIRTVVFTQLFKYDGTNSKTLAVRDFKQIAGRAGRRGFDTQGTVICQAPEHIIENLRLAQKAEKSGKKSFVKRKPPEKGFVPWDEKAFRRLIDSPPEKLISRFQIHHSTLLNVLSRSFEDGCRAMQKIIRICHENPQKKKALRKRAFQLFRGLLEGKILRIIPPSERKNGVKVALNIGLQEDFSMNQALGLWLINAIPQLDAAAPDHCLNVISLIEAILENPDVILRKQLDARKTQLIAEWKNEGIEFDKRMELLEEVEWPKPGKDFIYDTYNAYVIDRPWMKEASVRPKCIAREMFENWQSFEDYVKTYGIERSEAVLLRHISEVYKVLSQTVPPSMKNTDLIEAEHFFGDILRNVDSSLIDEWEALRNPDYLPAENRPTHAPAPVAFTRAKAAFHRAVRAAIFDFIKSLALENLTACLAAIETSDADGEKWTTSRLQNFLDEYFATHQLIRLDPEARSAKHTHITDENPRQWIIEQVLIDPDELNDWIIKFMIDLDQCDAAERVVMHLYSIETLCS